MVGTSRHFFFHIKHCIQFCIADHAGESSLKNPKCNKTHVGRGFAPDRNDPLTTLWQLTALPDPLVGGQGLPPLQKNLTPAQPLGLRAHPAPAMLISFLRRCSDLSEQRLSEQRLSEQRPVPERSSQFDMSHIRRNCHLHCSLQRMPTRTKTVAKTLQGHSKTQELMLINVDYRTCYQSSVIMTVYQCLLSPPCERSEWADTLFSSDCESVCMSVCADKRSIRQLGR